MSVAVISGAVAAVPVVSGVTDTVISGPFLLAAGLAVAAGVVSFASPCVVPLVPGYLSYLAGLVGAETADAAHPATTATVAQSTAVTTVSGNGTTLTATKAAAPTRSRVRWRAVGATCLFVAGFSLVFLLETALVLGVASSVLRSQQVLMLVGGVVTILMGLVLAGAIPLLQREYRPHVAPRGRFWGAPILGAAFGTGWLACTSPTLAGVVALSTSTQWNGNALRGLVLVVLYCAGLGIPFVLLALGFGWAGTMLGFLRRHSRVIQLVGAAALVVIGVLMVTGVWGDMIARLQGAVVVL